MALSKKKTKKLSSTGQVRLFNLPGKETEILFTFCLFLNILLRKKETETVLAVKTVLHFAYFQEEDIQTNHAWPSLCVANCCTAGG